MPLVNTPWYTIMLITLRHLNCRVIQGQETKISMLPQEKNEVYSISISDMKMVHGTNRIVNPMCAELLQILQK
jgi:hypothetical protein